MHYAHKGDEMSEAVKLCADCKHYEPFSVSASFAGDLAKCNRPGIDARQAVDGHSGVYAQFERTKLFFGCGRKAKYWEAK